MARFGRGFPTGLLKQPSKPVASFLGIGAGGASKSTWTDTVPATATAAVVYAAASSVTSPAATLGGVSMTSYSFNYNSTSYVLAFVLINPPTGSQSISITGSGTVGFANAVYYSNVSSVGTPQTLATTGYNGPSSHQITGVTNPNYVYSNFMSGYNVAFTNNNGYNKNTRYKTGTQTNPTVIGDCCGSGGALTFTMWTSGISFYLGSYVIPLIP
jgi:hypothetical protein